MDLVKIGVPADDPGGPVHPDLALAKAILRRDRKATADWVDRFTGPVYQYVRRRLLPRTDLADDLVQEIFIAAWQYLPGYQGLSPLGAWLMGIARHKVEDHYRRRLREWESWDAATDAPEPAGCSTPAIEDTLDRERRSEKTGRVLASLPEHYAAVLSWRYWECRSAREIGEATGRTEKAVERLLARARANFKRRWDQA